MSFVSLGLLPALVSAAQAHGLLRPTPIQAEAIPAILRGVDVLGAARTGSGKTAAFALPLLQRLSMHETPVASNSVRVLVLVPTRELAEQVSESFREYGSALGVKSFADPSLVESSRQSSRSGGFAEILEDWKDQYFGIREPNAKFWEGTAYQLQKAILLDPHGLFEQFQITYDAALGWEEPPAPGEADEREAVRLFWAQHDRPQGARCARAGLCDALR